MLNCFYKKFKFSAIPYLVLWDVLTASWYVNTLVISVSLRNYRVWMGGWEIKERLMLLWRKQIEFLAFESGCTLTRRFYVLSWPLHTCIHTHMRHPLLTSAHMYTQQCERPSSQLCTHVYTAMWETPSHLCTHVCTLRQDIYTQLKVKWSLKQQSQINFFTQLK